MYNSAQLISTAMRIGVQREGGGSPQAVRSQTGADPPIPRVISVKYPKLAAALDDLLARFVTDHAEDAVMAFLVSQSEPAIIVPVDIPVTKELVLSHQEEVRNGD